MVSIGAKPQEQGHLEMDYRWVDQYNFYINDEHWGRLFVRMCPYFPFSARICLNQHYWLANRMREEGLRFQQCKNAFLRCSDPESLQQLADSLTAKDLITCGQKWLAQLTPLFTARERKEAGCHHRLFFCQVEGCDNLIFNQRAAVDRLEQRLLDANRAIGQPKKLTIIFGRRITKLHKGQLQTVIEDLNLPNPVIRSHYNKGFVKQYVRDDRILRTEPATNDVKEDYKILKAVENLPPVARETRKHYRQLPGRAARHSGDLCRSWAVSMARRTHRVAEWQASSRLKAEPPAPVGSDAGLGSLFANRC